jgi:hypothetical protein
MGTSIQQYVAARRGNQDQGAIRLTVRVSQRNYAKLMKLSVELGAAKTGLAGDLLEAAITDAWAEFELPEPTLEEASRYEGEVERTDGLREAPDESSQSTDEKGTSVSNAWIFQANPKSYDIRAALSRVGEHDGLLTWLTTRYRKHMKSGDRVYLWEAGPEGGVLAVGTVAAEPAIRTNDEWQMQFARDRARFQVPDWRVVIRIDRVLPEPITRPEMENHAVLKTLDILTFWQQTNFRVSSEQDRALADLIREREHQTRRK